MYLVPPGICTILSDIKPSVPAGQMVQCTMYHTTVPMVLNTLLSGSKVSSVPAGQMVSIQHHTAVPLDLCTMLRCQTSTITYHLYQQEVKYSQTSATPQYHVPLDLCTTLPHGSKAPSVPAGQMVSNQYHTAVRQ